MDILVFGSAIVDFICYVPRLPKTGETLHGTKFVTGFGGKGANQCVAAAKLGAKTALIAKLGNDSWGQDYIENLKQQNVNTDFIEILSKQTTGIAQISVAENGDNNIVIVTGANKLLSEKDVQKSQELFKKSKVLVCQLETPIEATIYALKQFQGISILNAAPALADTPIEIIQIPTIFCVNEAEASLMIKSDVNNIEDAKHAINELIKLGANTVIITLGEHGVIFSEKSERKIIHVHVKKVTKVVDTTGAGDAFIGALAYYLAMNPEQKLYMQIGGACEYAARTVQSMGTQSSFPTRNNFQIDFNSLEVNWSIV